MQSCRTADSSGGGGGEVGEERGWEVREGEGREEEERWIIMKLVWIDSKKHKSHL